MQFYAPADSSKFLREFSRPARNFEHIDKWKATELRAFLLYGGDRALAMPEVNLPPVLISAFRCLSIAVRLLSDPVFYTTCNEFAMSLITCFVDSCVEFFGDHFVSLIVHLLLHLPEECLKFGPLDRFSCWKYENTLKSIKKRCRNFKTPLTALMNQLKVKSTFVSKPGRDFMRTSSAVTCIRPIRGSGMVMGNYYKTIFYKNHVLTIYPPDCYFYSKNKVFRIKEIVQTANEGVKMICHTFDRAESAYYITTSTDRFESSRIGIMKLKEKSYNLQIIHLANLNIKA